MTAVGVARPSAHGQAIQRTEMAQRNANWTVISVLEYKSLAYNNVDIIYDYLAINFTHSTSQMS